MAGFFALITSTAQAQTIRGDLIKQFSGIDRTIQAVQTDAQLLDTLKGQLAVVKVLAGTTRVLKRAPVRIKRKRK